MLTNCSFKRILIVLALGLSREGRVGYDCIVDDDYVLVGIVYGNLAVGGPWSWF